MATIKEIAEGIIRTNNGGIYTDETRLSDLAFLTYLINNVREIVLTQVWAKDKRLDAGDVQYITLKKDDAIQDSDCYVKFAITSPIVLDRNNDGFRYVGSATQNINFMRAKSRGFASMFKHRITNFNNPNYTTWLYSNGAIEVYGAPDIETIRVDILAANPFKIPNFNKDFDDYPLSEGSIVQLDKYINDNYMRLIMGRPIDMIPTSEDQKSSQNNKV